MEIESKRTENYWCYHHAYFREVTRSLYYGRSLLTLFLLRPDIINHPTTEMDSLFMHHYRLQHDSSSAFLGKHIVINFFEQLYIFSDIEIFPGKRFPSFPKIPRFFLVAQKYRNFLRHSFNIVQF